MPELNSKETVESQYANDSEAIRIRDGAIAIAKEAGVFVSKKICLK